MHSAELARIAGVTVRTLRHYHQLGILEEPPRSSGGYREYDVHHLVRLLRIRRLTGLGFSLDSLPSLLDGTESGEAEEERLLEELDAELAHQADRIAAQRAIIAQLRRDRLAPDLPPSLARYSAVFAATGASPDSVRFDREQLILLAHLAGKEGEKDLERFYALVAEPGVLERSLEFNKRFGMLDSSTTDEELEAFVSEMVAEFAPLVREFTSEGGEMDFSSGEKLLLDYSRDVLNPTQLRAIELMEAGLAASLDPRS